MHGFDKSEHTPVCCLATYYPVRVCAAGLCIWLHWFVYVCTYVCMYVCMYVYVVKKWAVWGLTTGKSPVSIIN